MNWIAIGLVIAVLYTLSSFVDNYVTDELFRDKKPQALKTVDGILYLILAVILICIFGFKSIPIIAMLGAFCCGIATSASSIPYYLALRNEETTTATIFYQLSPLVYMLADFFFLSQHPNLQQFIGFIVILLAPIIVVTSRRRKKSRKMEFRSAILFTLYVIAASCSGVGFAKLKEQGFDFYTLFFFFLLGRGLFDVVVTVICKSWRIRIKQVLKKHPVRNTLIISSSLFFAIAGDFLLRWTFQFTATSLISVFVNASELILTFILGIILTLIIPKFGREKLNRHIVIAHLIAVILATTGIILIQ